MGVSRITDSMMNYGFLSGMNKSLNTQYSLMEQMSDGKRIHRPSDDPVRVLRSLQYRSAIMQNEQYVSNVKDAQSWMEMTDKAVGDLSDLVSQAKSLVVRAIEPNSTVGYAAAAKQLDGIINQAIQVANTQIGDRYIFAGQMDKTQPFQRVMLEDPTGQSNLKVDTVVYYGDDQKISMVTQSGLPNVGRDGINLTGIDVFGRVGSTPTQYGQATTDVFNMLIRVKEELEKTAAVTKTNSLGGTLDVDGGYTGPAEYQDFAVKIDALKVRLNTYAQSNTGGGSLALSWTKAKASMPAYASPNSLQMRIDALKVAATVTAPLGHVTGGLTLESTTNQLPVAAAGELQFRVDAVQVESGAVRQSNPLAGNLSVVYNGYKGTPPANLLLKTTVSPAANVLQTNATGGALTVTGIAGSADAATRVRIDAVVAGEVTAASYFDTLSNSWQTATVTAGPPSALTLGSTGMTATIEAAAGNAAGDQYTLNATKRVTGVEYSTNGTWPGVAATGTFVAQSNAAGGTASVSPQQSIPYKVEIIAVDGAGQVTDARVSTDGGLTWGATQSGLTGSVTLANGAVMTIATDLDNAAGNTYEYKVPPTFTLNNVGNDIGMQISIADSTENGSGTDNIYTIPLTSTGKAMQASYSTDNGATWTAATSDNAVNPFRFNLAGSFSGFSVQLGTVATNLVGDVHHIKPTVTAPADHVTGALSIAAAADTVIAASELQFRVDTVAPGTGQVLTASYSTDNGATWTAATPDVPGNPVNFALMGTVQAQLGAVPTNAAGDIHSIRMTDGTVARASFSTDGGGTWTTATADTTASAGSFIFGDTGFNGAIAKNSTNNGGNTYTLSDLSIDASTEAAALSYSLDHGNTWVKAVAPMVTKSTADSGELTLGGKYTGLPAFQDIKATVQAWKVNTTAITQSPPAPVGGTMKLAYAGAGPLPAIDPQVRIDAVDTAGHVTALSSSDDGGLTWTSATAQSSQGPVVFSLGGGLANYSVTIADNANNAVNTEYTATGAALVAGDPALISFTTEPAPDVNGTITPSASVWSMKGADPNITDFALADGVTADIEVNSATTLGTSSYSFRIPPRFELAYGVEVSIDPNANNLVKDAHTFHMARDTEHTSASETLGPDLDWLSDKGLSDLDKVHDQILTALVDVGSKASMYEMTGNMLESSYNNLTSVLATNEDVDMAKAIIDMKTAENTYKAALSFGARIMPTSLVDFLR
jgi:flagellar hook-associated protein 3